LKIAAAIHDLMFSSKVNAAAAGQPVVWLPRGTPVAPWVTEQKPDVLLIDLGNQKNEPIESIRALKGAEATKGILVIGYIGHEQEETIAAARAAGCDKVMSKGAFASQLPALLRG
jgi:DNA-binding NarL/FixJ family response regulator